MRCFGQGRTVGLPRGFWENYVNAVSLASGHAVTLDYFDHNGALDIDGLSRQIESTRPSVLIMNFPANPTGAVLEENEARALGQLARRYDLVLVSDEVYARLRYDGRPPLTLLAEAPERVVVVSSASKEYLLPGARVGYVVSARPALTDDAIRKLVRANTACPNVPGQRLLLPLVQADLEELRAGRQPAFLSRVRDEMRARMESLVSVLKKHGFPLAGRRGHDPMGTIFLMAELPPWWEGNDVEFVEEALERHCVSVIPGSAFGLEGTIRFSFGGMTQTAIAQLDRNLEAWRRGR
jgi:aminotransferase